MAQPPMIEFQRPDGQAVQGYLASITWAGAKERYQILTPEAEERISFELGVIQKMGFVTSKKMLCFVC